jgi:tRNA threonylcarbamoyladenosine biosynthesis protein TsaB
MTDLVIDASTYRGTVAVLRDRTVLAKTESVMRGADADALMPAVVSALEAARVDVGKVDRVICGAGPGSFTSLRIAAGIAKGISLGGGIPLFAVPSMGLILAASDAVPGRYIVTTDALRGEWYAGLYDRAEDGEVSEARAFRVVPAADIDATAKAESATIIGDAGRGERPHAAGCVHLLRYLENAEPINLESWEPTYGRLAEAQVKWEAAHGRPIGA